MRVISVQRESGERESGEREEGELQEKHQYLDYSKEMEMSMLALLKIVVEMNSCLSYKGRY